MYAVENIGQEAEPGFEPIPRPPNGNGLPAEPTEPPPENGVPPREHEDPTPAPELKPPTGPIDNIFDLAKKNPLLSIGALILLARLLKII